MPMVDAVERLAALCRAGTETRLRRVAYRPGRPAGRTSGRVLSRPGCCRRDGDGSHASSDHRRRRRYHGKAEAGRVAAPSVLPAYDR